MHGSYLWKATTILAGALIVLLVVSSCVLLPRRAFPKTRGSLEVAGLEHRVEIVRDRFGVPHI